MSVASHCDVQTGVVCCLGGFEDGSVLAWDTRMTDRELAGLKLFSEPSENVDLSIKKKQLINYFFQHCV